jgi:hypothetical protein
MFNVSSFNKIPTLLASTLPKKLNAGETSINSEVKSVTAAASNKTKLRADMLDLFNNNTVYKIRLFATMYQPRHVDGYQIHNRFFTPLKPSAFNASELERIFKDLSSKGSFKVATSSKTGLIRTSDKDDAHHMSRQWFTDSTMMFPLQRTLDPEGWKKNMMTNAAALNHPEAQRAAQETLKNPDWFRKGSVKNGVFHIYWPSSVELDANELPKPEKIKLDETWFSQNRLESQALMTLRLLETLKAGLIPNKNGQLKPWGFHPQDLEGRMAKNEAHVTNAIHSMSRYLIAVNTDPKTKKFDFHTPSASSWEEMPFKEGMTWDAAVTVVAMEKLKKFLYGEKFESPTLNRVKAKILKDNPTELSKENLEKFIAAGRTFVDSRITHPLQRGKDPVQTPNRPYDTSLSLLAASDYQLVPNNLLKDTQLRLDLLKKTKAALSGPHGMRRYNEFTETTKAGKPIKLHDSYLNINHHMPESVLAPILKKPVLVKSGYERQGDASDAETLLERQDLSQFKYTAQWQLGLSASLQSLAKMKIALLREIQQKGAASAEEKKLLKEINKESLDFVNRNVAAIPGPLPGTEKLIKADGSPCQPYIPLEAYQAIPDLNNEIKYVPGDHSLPWHSSQLFDGLRKTLRAQKMEESLRSKGLLDI